MVQNVRRELSRKVQAISDILRNQGSNLYHVSGLFQNCAPLAIGYSIIVTSEAM